MAQVGVHGLTGVLAGMYLVAPLVPDRTARRGLMFGYVMGNMAPDLDFLAVVGMYPIDQVLAFQMHRSFSHSLLAAFAVAFGLTLAANLMHDRYFRFFGYGLALGIASHFTLDALVWFSPVDIFWPLSVWGMVPPVDLWFWISPPLLVGRLLGAAEFAAFGLYFDYLARAVEALETDLEMLRPLRSWSTICWTTWAFISSLALDLPDGKYDFYVYIPMGIVFVPACFYLTWRVQTTLELLGVFGRLQSKK